MAEINAKDVMNLRNKTGLAMMACKKALIEADGDIVLAEDLLRKQLKGKMETKVDRAAGQGRIEVAVSDDGKAAVIVELRAETDFTAKNDKFVDATKKIAQLTLQAPVGSTGTPSAEVEAIVDDLRISTGENISIGRIEKLESNGSNTVYGKYVHHDGKTGVLIEAEGEVPEDTLRQIAMHVTAAFPRPLGLTSEDIPTDLIEKERKFRIEQAMESGKPREIAEKMVEGGMRKFFAEVALVEQAFVMDPSKTIKEVVGSGGNLKKFRRWEVGESVG